MNFYFCWKAPKNRQILGDFACWRFCKGPLPAQTNLHSLADQHGSYTFVEFGKHSSFSPLIQRIVLQKIDNVHVVKEKTGNMYDNIFCFSLKSD